MCDNDKCPYLHCTSFERIRYETTGRLTENMQREVSRSLQDPSLCGDYKNGNCKRNKCKLKHVKFNDTPFECCVCRDDMTVQNFGAADCGHMFCFNYALRCIHDRCNDLGLTINVTCPLCRQTQPYRKLS